MPHHVAMAATVIRTERLVLRGWRDEDRATFAALNADPEVMEHFMDVLDRATSDAEAEVMATNLERDGWGHWAVTLPEDDEFLGFTGMDVVDFPARWTPACTPCSSAGSWGRSR